MRCIAAPLLTLSSSAAAVAAFSTAPALPHNTASSLVSSHPTARSSDAALAVAARRRRRAFVALSASSGDVGDAEGGVSKPATKTDAPSGVEISSSAAASSSTAAPSSSLSSSSDADEPLDRIQAELREIGDCISLALDYASKPDGGVEAADVVRICDDLDALSSSSSSSSDTDAALLSKKLGLRATSLRWARYQLLVKMLKTDYDAYVATASFLSPSRIPRNELPNLQDVPYDEKAEEAAAAAAAKAKLQSEEGLPLVADCELDDVSYDDSLLDKILLKLFRNLVAENTGGVTSDKPGIEGLLEQGRSFMLKPNQTPEAQHEMVQNTLGGLMTPYLPPFYRVFMSGIVPKVGTEWDGKQIGPWFYAPWLTSIVTPTFFGFLVGPSYPNRRKDGGRGGLVVEKCKFLQESGCKGLCLHQCKLPAQQFFQDELGLPLTVSPNFVTQECQWSFGEVPLPPQDDPSFPKGCLVGCESRKAMAGTYADQLG